MRYSQSVNGTPILPGPGSYLEQDAELLWAFEIFEGKRAEWQDILKTRAEQAEAIAKFQTEHV